MSSKQNLKLSTVIQKCAAYFNVLAVISVVEYDYCPNRLFKLLESLKKDTFDVNDRIIFHFDKDLYCITKGVESIVSCLLTLYVACIIHYPNFGSFC
jgi:hypothetical protein